MTKHRYILMIEQLEIDARDFHGEGELAKAAEVENVIRSIRNLIKNCK